MSHFNNVPTVTFCTVSGTDSETKDAGQQVKRVLPARKSVFEPAFQNIALLNAEPGAEPTKPKRGTISPKQHTMCPPEAHSIHSLLGFMFFSPVSRCWQSTGGRVPGSSWNHDALCEMSALSTRASSITKQGHSISPKLSQF